MKNLQTFEEFVNEAKKVGPLYHFTKEEHIESIKTKGIRFNKDNSTLKNIKYSISTTRDKKQKPWSYDIRITLDGDAISERYKIMPINVENVWATATKKSSKHGDFFEERIIANKPGYLNPKYIY